MKIWFQNKQILIVNIYAPNGAKKNFYGDIQERISAANCDYLIRLGDFNGTVDNKLDRYNKDKKKKNTKGRLPKSFFNLVENEGIIDIWRKRNGKNKDYTFYSDRHNTWSRTDMIKGT